MIEATQAKQDTDLYLDSFAQLQEEVEGKQPPWLQQIRQAAISRFSELGFPTPRQEEWKYTEVAPIRRTAFKPAAYERNGLTSERLNELSFGNLRCPRLVFVNGHYSAELSSLNGLPKSVQVQSLAVVLEQDPDRVEAHLARYADYQDHPFVALNTALIQDGALIHVPKGEVIDEPIHLLYLSTAAEEAIAIHPRNLIIAESNLIDNILRKPTVTAICAQSPYICVE